MKARLDISKAAPEAYAAVAALDRYIVKESGLEPGIVHLIKIRASQINGCAFCIYMHVVDARQHGETDLRIQMLDAWRESPLYTDRERAALAWTESLTFIATTRAPDSDYALVKAQFSDAEIAALSLLIGQINSWNRLQVAARTGHAVQPAASAA